MNVSELPPSKEWAPMKYRGETLAEVWFKPDGEPFAVLFRIPQTSFQIAGIGQRLTMESLLKSVGIPTDEVESWHFPDTGDSSSEGSTSELGHPLPPPSQDMSHRMVHVSLKPPTLAPASNESGETENLEVKWSDLEARWKAIEGLEANVDSLRIRLEGLRVQMEASTRKMLNAEEKLHALNADVARWNKAKSRIHFTLPKLREFTHRATWAVGTPERKQLQELLENSIPNQTPIPQFVKILDQLENLLKDRQILSAQGVSVSQECDNVFAEVEGALKTLQSNAAANLRKKQGANRAKGKFFKDVRRWTGAE